MGQYIFHTSLRNENNKYVFGSTVELCFTFAFSFFFFLFLIHAQQLLGDNAQFITVCVLFIKKKLKIQNGFNGIIHTFKNYFATVFLVFSFQF